MTTGYAHVRRGWTFPNLSARMADVAAGELDWKRLGDLARRRREDLGLTQAEVQARGGPSVATLRYIESAAQEGYRGSVLRNLERALDWPPDTIDTILAGGNPPGATGDRRPTVDTADLDAHENMLLYVANNPHRSEGIRRWARSLLDQIAQLREAEQHEAERGDQAAS